MLKKKSNVNGSKIFIVALLIKIQLQSLHFTFFVFFQYWRRSQDNDSAGEHAYWRCSEATRQRSPSGSEWTSPSFAFGNQPDSGTKYRNHLHWTRKMSFIITIIFKFTSLFILLIFFNHCTEIPHNTAFGALGIQDRCSRSWKNLRYLILIYLLNYKDNHR